MLVLRHRLDRAGRKESPYLKCRLETVFYKKIGFQAVHKVEQELGGALMDKPQPFRFQDGGKALTFTVEGIVDGWRVKSHVRYQEIPFSHIWSSQQSLLHSSFTLEPTHFPVQNLPQCTVFVRQLDGNNAQTLRMQSISINEVNSNRCFEKFSATGWG